MPDPTDVKPEGYDDIPKEIADPDAKKPEDWDDEDDGEVSRHFLFLRTKLAAFATFH